jgi:hypothetical protein
MGRDNSMRALRAVRWPAGRSGYVDWPEELRNHGANGTFVWALFPGDDLPKGTRFEYCLGVADVVSLNGSVDIAGPDPTGWYDEHAAHRVDLPEFAERVNQPLLAAVCLGSSSRSYWTTGPDEGFWQATRKDLTSTGRDLVTVLEHLYEREARLCTYVDT